MYKNNSKKGQANQKSENPYSHHYLIPTLCGYIRMDRKGKKRAKGREIQLVGRDKRKGWEEEEEKEEGRRGGGREEGGVGDFGRSRLTYKQCKEQLLQVL